MLLKLEAFGGFEDPENVKSLTPSIYKFLETELNLEEVDKLLTYAFIMIIFLRIV